MKVSLFAVRTADIAEVSAGGGKGTVIRMQDSEVPLPVYRVDADLPETWSGRVAERSPYLDQAMATLREAVVKQIGVSDGTMRIERGKALKDLLNAVEDKTDVELKAIIKVATSAHEVVAGLVAMNGAPKPVVSGGIVININALDAKGVIERSADIARAIQLELEKGGPIGQVLKSHLEGEA
jgi:hypothetical protein